jgi:hypothetical protein
MFRHQNIIAKYIVICSFFFVYFSRNYKSYKMKSRKRDNSYTLLLSFIFWVNIFIFKLQYNTFFLYRWGLKPNVTLFCFVHTIRITLFNWSVNMESRSSAANVNGAYLDSLHLSIRMFTLYKKLIRSNWSYISVKRHTWTWLTSKLNLFSKHVLNWETILQFQKF